ncbi:MAG: hypothetical protein DI549_14500 [Ancylobacter novellus]|uniref:Uncharacterized protein n=1 Tax=Ancylobacter novellus TaxID=921 RepID=A0A2W5QRE4_ANCNO|nr:MAG: hypothetical protein DI549_14500 [Ancylobacter novellus]
MNVTVALINLIAGLLLLVVCGALAVHLPRPRRWMVAAFVAVDAGLLVTSLLALPFILHLGLE